MGQPCDADTAAGTVWEIQIGTNYPMATSEFTPPLNGDERPAAVADKICSANSETTTNMAVKTATKQRAIGTGVAGWVARTQINGVSA